MVTETAPLTALRGAPGPRLHLTRGDMFPDVKLYTGAGEEFRTTRLKGSHTVLVFGCLT